MVNWHHGDRAFQVLTMVPKFSIKGVQTIAGVERFHMPCVNSRVGSTPTTPTNGAKH